MSNLADKFYDRQGVTFNREDFDCSSATSIHIAPELTGYEWNDVTLGFLYQFAPCWIRVIKDGGAETLDGRSGRITVYVDSDNKIESIEMEADVGLPTDVPHGDALRDALDYGVDSPQLDWHRNAEGYFHDGINGIIYARIDGQLVKYPED